MTIEQEELKLRFQAGRFEQQLIFLVLILQTTLVAIAGFATLWTVHMTVGAYLDPEEPALLYADWILYPIVMVAIIYLLDRLYE